LIARGPLVQVTGLYALPSGPEADGVQDHTMPNYCLRPLTRRPWQLMVERIEVLILVPLWILRPAFWCILSTASIITVDHTRLMCRCWRPVFTTTNTVFYWSTGVHLGEYCCLSIVPGISCHIRGRNSS